MRSSFLRFLVPAMACLIVSGCGGSSGSGGGGGGDTNPTAVTFTFTGATPAAVATQIGSGAFTAATLSSNTLTISVPGGTKNFAIAWACAPAAVIPASDPDSGNYYLDFTTQYVFEASTVDGTSFEPYSGCALSSSSLAGTTGNLTMNVDASAFSSSEDFPYLEIEATNGAHAVNGGPSSPGLVLSDYSFAAPQGNDEVDLLVEGEITGALSGVVALKRFSGQAVPGALSGGNTVVFGPSDGVGIESLTYNNEPANSIAVSSVFATPAGQSVQNVLPADDFAPFWSVFQTPAGGQENRYRLASMATKEYPALPASIAQSGDEYTVFASSFNSQSGSQEPQVSEILNFTGGGPQAITFPTPWSYDGPTPAALPTMDFPTYTGFAGQTGVAKVGILSWFPFNDVIQYQVAATDNYLGSSTSIAFPDLSSLTGFQAAPASSDSVHWYALIVQSDSGIYQSVPASSREFEVAADGIYTVP